MLQAVSPAQTQSPDFSAVANNKRLDTAPGLFSERVIDAADHGKLPHVGVLIADLERAARVARGLKTLFSIIGNNELFGRDGKPLCADSIESLAVLGEEAAAMLVSGIDETAEWAERTVMEAEHA